METNPIAPPDLARTPDQLKPSSRVASRPLTGPKTSKLNGRSGIVKRPRRTDSNRHAASSKNVTTSSPNTATRSKREPIQQSSANGSPKYASRGKPPRFHSGPARQTGNSPPPRSKTSSANSRASCRFSPVPIPQIAKPSTTNSTSPSPTTMTVGCRSPQDLTRVLQSVSEGRV